VEAYEQLGYQMVELPKGSVEERAAFIVDHIEDLGRRSVGAS
jgi:predicted ATPase